MKFSALDVIGTKNPVDTKKQFKITNEKKKGARKMSIKRYNLGQFQGFEVGFNCSELSKNKANLITHNAKEKYDAFLCKKIYEKLNEKNNILLITYATIEKPLKDIEENIFYHKYSDEELKHFGLKYLKPLKKENHTTTSIGTLEDEDFFNLLEFTYNLIKSDVFRELEKEVYKKKNK